MGALSMIRSLRKFARDQRGVSAVEFAMLAPLMLTMFFGSVEVSQGISIDRKLTLTARTVADLASQVTNINNADMTNLLKASQAVISPYSTTALGVTVSLIKIDANSKATIEWSDTLNGTARSKGSSVTLPGALLVPNTSLVWGEVKYSYTPTIGYVMTGTLNLSDQLYMRPRLSDSITRSAT
jgi:Flp pilus assembly protein TadG